MILVKRFIKFAEDIAMKNTGMQKESEYKGP